MAMIMKQIFGLGLLSILFSAGLTAQSLLVYPGDVNNNGIVNNIDFLGLGLAYNLAGPERIPQSTAFAPQPATPWQYSFLNGLNMAYADCNGDGLVNYYYDAFPVYVHYGQKHDSLTADVYSAGIPGSDPSLHLDISSLIPPVSTGQVLELPILLGDAQHPVEDFYGLAFSMHFDPSVVDPAQVQFNFNQTSWANPDNNQIYMYKDVSNSRVDVAWVRTDHNQKSGYGPVGKVQIVIVVDVIAPQPCPIHFDSLKMIDKFGITTTVVGDSINFTVSPAALTTDQETRETHYFQVSPVPASDYLHIRHDAPIELLTLFDPLGQPLMTQFPDQPVVDLPIGQFPPGPYLLQCKSRNGSFIRKIIIQP
jgi:hypothetical protein